MAIDPIARWSCAPRLAKYTVTGTFKSHRYRGARGTRPHKTTALRGSPRLDARRPHTSRNPMFGRLVPMIPYSPRPIVVAVTCGSYEAAKPSALLRTKSASSIGLCVSA
jgi:hypothetical protein